MPAEVKFIIKTKTLQLLAKFLERNANELNITIKDGIKVGIQGMSGFHGANIYLPKEALKNLEGESVLGIDTTQLSQIAKTFEGDEVELRREQAMLYLKDKAQESFVRLIQPDETEAFGGFKKEFPAKFTLDAGELTSALKIGSKFGSYVNFIFNGSKKEFVVSFKKMTTGFEKKLPVKEGKGSEGDSMYQLEFIHDILEGASGDLKIEIGKDMPIKFDFKLGEASCQSFVAPRSG